MPERTCLTCKYEPEWIIQKNVTKHGFCKKLPIFMQGVFLYNEGHYVTCQVDSYETPIEVTNCNLWEAKDER